MRDTTTRVLLVIVAAGNGIVGLWASLAPHSFYDDFPGGGRHWVAVDGPFNEHLVRDVGTLNLALTVLAVAALVRPSRYLIQVLAGAVPCPSASSTASPSPIRSTDARRSRSPLSTVHSGWRWRTTASSVGGGSRSCTSSCSRRSWRCRWSICASTAFRIASCSPRSG